MFHSCQFSITMALRFNYVYCVYNVSFNYVYYSFMTLHCCPIIFMQYLSICHAMSMVIQCYLFIHSIFPIILINQFNSILKHFCYSIQYLIHSINSLFIWIQSIIHIHFLCSIHVNSFIRVFNYIQVNSLY